jgi:hypothetical protein
LLCGQLQTKSARGPALPARRAELPAARRARTRCARDAARHAGRKGGVPQLRGARGASQAHHPDPGADLRGLPRLHLGLRRGARACGAGACRLRGTRSPLPCCAPAAPSLRGWTAPAALRQHAKCALDRPSTAVSPPHAQGIHNAHVVLPTTHVVSTHGFSFSSSGSGNATAVPYGASAAFGSSGGGDGGGGLPAEGQQPSMQSGSGGGGEREVDELDLPLRRLRSIFATAAMPRPR